jgi:hypothetical protein
VAIIKAPLHGNKTGKRNKATHGTALTRPLICICNDHYTPALSELRKLSLVFVLQPPTQARLIERLKAISLKENLSVTGSSLTSLSSAAGSDIRSAINTLQWAALETKKMIATNTGKTKADLHVDRTLSQMISTGLKDEKRDIFQIWREIFSLKEMTARLNLKRDRALGDERMGVSAGGSTGASTGASVMGVRTVVSTSHRPAMEAMTAVSDYGTIEVTVRIGV